MPLKETFHMTSYPSSRAHALEHAAGRRVVQVVDDRAVGEEQHPLGVTRGDADRASPSRSSGRSRGPRSRMNVRICSPALESRFPVGSSANTMSGRLTSAGDGNALLLAARKLRRPVPEAFDAGRRCSTTRSSHSRSTSTASGDDRQGDVLQRGQRRNQIERLEHEPDAIAADPRQGPFAERA